MTSGFAVTSERASRTEFSDPYTDLTLAFAVPDHRRNEFSSRDSVQALTGLTVAVPDMPLFADPVRRCLPDAEIAVLESPRSLGVRRTKRRGRESLDARCGAEGPQ